METFRVYVADSRQFKATLERLRGEVSRRCDHETALLLLAEIALLTLCLHDMGAVIPLIVSDKPPVVEPVLFSHN